MTKDHRLNLNQWLDHVKETYEDYGYDYEFIEISDVQLNMARTKPLLGSDTELPPGLRSRTKAILNVRNNKFCDYVLQAHYSRQLIMQLEKVNILIS